MKTLFDVLIIMGSGSDEKKMSLAKEVLDKCNVPSSSTIFEYRISSAHRTPDRTREIVWKAEEAGCKVIICGAGMAAHLAGAVASATILPVIGVPLTSDASPLFGIDALLSTVQMPPGIPVATVAIDRADNAAWLAVQILALSDSILKNKLLKVRKEMADKVEKADDKLQQKLADGREE